MVIYRKYNFVLNKYDLNHLKIVVVIEGEHLCDYFGKN